MLIHDLVKLTESLTTQQGNVVNGPTSVQYTGNRETIRSLQVLKSVFICILYTLAHTQDCSNSRNL